MNAPLSTLPKVTIITPSFNQGQFLEATIQSVLSQDYPNLEYMIIDGGSKDQSVEIIQRYADRLAYWVSEKDRGHADALNKGFARASGEILAWLNSDDVYHPGAVREAVQALQADPAVGMVYGNARLTDEHDTVVGQFAARQTDYDRLLHGSVHIPQATTFWRADLFRQVGPLSLELYFAFDYDLWVKLAKVSKLQHVPRVWADFRLHAAGKSVKDDDRCYPDMIRIVARETGQSGSRLVQQMRLRWLARKLFYAWLPWRMRVWLRKAATL